jgi:hypothetical protein
MIVNYKKASGLMYMYISTPTLTFLLTKHFNDYNNVFLKDSSYSKSAVCSAPVVIVYLDLNVYNCS